MSDQSERKTLSLSPGTKKKASNAEPRVRSGARARAASLQQDRQGGPKRESRPYVEKRDQERRERPAFNRDRTDRPQSGERREFSGERREFSGERRERPAFNRDRDSRPQTGERREFSGERRERPAFDRNREGRPQSGERREFSGERRERPAFNRDRDSRPQSGERREFSGERRERPAFNRDRDSRPQSGERREFSGERRERPAFNRDRDSRPQSGEHREFSGERRERPAFNRDRDSRPQSGERREFSGERRERPAFNRDRDSRPQSGERREFSGERRERPAFNRDRDSRPQSGERREFSGERRERPAFNRDRDSRPQSGERREFSGERRERPAFDRNREGRPQSGERREFSGERRERPAFDRNREGRPQSGERREFSGERRERPAFDRNREGRPQSGERREFSGERRERPAFDRNREGRPQSGERREFSGERRERPAFNRDRDSRPQTGERRNFSGERRERPAFKSDNESSERTPAGKMPSKLFSPAGDSDAFPQYVSPIQRVDSPQAPKPGQRLPDSNIEQNERVQVKALQGERYRLFAPCPQGLEEALSLELQALGYENVQTGRAGCHFDADWIGVMRANLSSRLATRILLEVSHAPVTNEEDILALARVTPWERWFGPEQTLRVDTSAVRSPMQSLQYCNLRAKDGICDRLRDLEGARPSIDTVRPDAKVHLFLDETSATFYLDTSGESLFKRGWRHDKGDAPLRENLAAGLLALSGWDPSKPLIDPFCGSGTILIEAAWMALGAPPGIWRPFHFERLRCHDQRLWRDIKDEARSMIAPRLDTPLIGYDINPIVLDAARSNLERSHLTLETIRFEQGDALKIRPETEAGWIVTNPPYGERLEHQDEDFWPNWASNLKQNFANWSVNMISSDLELPRHMRLKPKRRYPLYNGALDCRLFCFDMVPASYRNNEAASDASEDSASAE
ncbi:Ribosomal RNA large subunit methyltransferase L [Alcaligenes faecalis]|uniref:THUMP domain-containing protein n=3 Tax=Alcaligenes faecalis TaxID=511 RepID=UPI0006C3C89F|nr:DNA methyltransferase [Alcaligenes faecalis subsp. faecalis NBRC 13111]CAJ0906944.1 putative N6-adenine-specific DNA methylase [Alcaligenes faecalis subsp. faecalis]CUI57579.1 Ribosomal RNA large subunit methyltransferase L [Alcaligenes faecalis]